MIGHVPTALAALIVLVVGLAAKLPSGTQPRAAGWAWADPWRAACH
jgi:hypothetical protein